MPSIIKSMNKYVRLLVLFVELIFPSVYLFFFLNHGNELAAVGAVFRVAPAGHVTCDLSNYFGTISGSIISSGAYGREEIQKMFGCHVRPFVVLRCLLSSYRAGTVFHLNSGVKKHDDVTHILGGNIGVRDGPTFE